MNNLIQELLFVADAHNDEEEGAESSISLLCVRAVGEMRRLLEISRVIGELEHLATRSNNDLLVENERLREENEHLRATQPQQSPWQPIATAPKDGTHVLLSYPGRITYGYWLVLEVGKLVGDCGGVCRCPEYDEAPDPFWYSEDGGFTEEHPPTHWMPLPEPAP